MTVGRKVSYAQNAEDVRVWRAFRDRDSQAGLIYVDVGANEPRHLSITASLSDLGWSGLLIEADPELAEQLRVHRPGYLLSHHQNDAFIAVNRLLAAGQTVRALNIRARTGAGADHDVDARSVRRRESYEARERIIGITPPDLDRRELVA